jgi:hypothetical protein
LGNSERQENRNKKDKLIAGNKIIAMFLRDVLKVNGKGFQKVNSFSSMISNENRDKSGDFGKLQPVFYTFSPLFRKSSQ